MAKRIWVIDVPEDWAGREARTTRPPGGRPPAIAGPAPRPAERVPAQEAPIATATRRHRRRGVQRSWPLALAYALGPFALFLIRPGRGNLVWASFGAASIAAWIWIATHRVELMTRVEDGGLSAVSLLAGAGAVLLITFTAWAVALLEAGRSRRFRAPRLRGPLRRLRLIAALGLLLPGLGLLIIGQRRRAAWAIAMVGPPLAAAVLLGHASWLWHLDPSRSAVGMSPHDLEVLFLASALILASGILIWLVQALDAARLAARASRRASDGGAMACWLLLAIAVFAITFRPAAVGRELDHFATAMRLEDYRLIPLCLELGAMRFDPSVPEYEIHAADLCDDLGWPAPATELRAGLDARWATYAWMRGRHAGDARGRPPARPGHLESAIPLKEPTSQRAFGLTD